MTKSFNSNAYSGNIALNSTEEADHRYQDQFQDPNMDLNALGAAGLAPERPKLSAVPEQTSTNTSWTPKVAANNPDVLARERIQMLQQLNSLILQPLPFDQLVGFSLSIVSAAVKSTVASVLELDYKSSEFFFRASTGGDAGKLSDIRIPASEGIAGYVAQNKSVELISNANEDKRHMTAISRLAGKELSNCIAAPILVGGKVFGVLEVFNPADGMSFSTEDKSTVEMAMPVISKILEVRFFAAEVTR